MPHRLNRGGRLIDRETPVAYRFNGKWLQGFAGDTLASALLASGRSLMGRSFKYHRPRGLVAAGVEEPNALMTVGEGARAEPNQRATMTELFDGLTAKSQNHWPSLEYDIGALNAAAASVAPVFSAGFYYKTFLFPRIAWKHLYEPFIRQTAGLGPAPTEPDPDEYEHFHAFTDVLVVGAGQAGLAAALAAGRAGARVLLVEQGAHPGGRLLSETDIRIDGQDGAEWTAARVAELEAMANVTIRTRCQAAGLYDHGYALLNERCGDHLGVSDGPRHRLWRVRAKRIVIAAGAIERPLVFADNDLPGVMLASAVRDYIALWGVAPGREIVVFANNDDAYRTAIAAFEAGLRVPAIVDSRTEVAGALPERARALGIEVRAGATVVKAVGGGALKGVTIARRTADGRVGGAVEEIGCDCLAMSGGWSPVVHLYSHCGGKLAWDEAQAMFRPAPERGAPTDGEGAVNTFAAGAANGLLGAAEGMADGWAAGARAAAELGRAPGAAPASVVDEPEMAPLVPLWFAPSVGRYAHGTKHFLDYQNDVTAADIELAAREGYESVEHAKRYTTLGMATDQGKLSNINGLAILANSLNTPVPEVGTTTFRPPYTPISLGAIAGRDAGALFKPLRRTAMHDWHEDAGADWEPVAEWRRPYCYRRPGETREDAVIREVLAVRRGVGMLDASTLGKILVKGPDAGRFLDLLYTNMMSTLKPGRCRYGLMCNENGFLFDDGVVARIGEDEFLCHTTSGGADGVHGWMEEWLQTEWWDFKVFTANLTEQYAQVAVAGPKAREVLTGLTDIDLSAEALPFMALAEGEIAGVPARIYRISFSGELSYEIAAPAHRGQALWDAICAAGSAHGITPYGTEALHVMRAEKGFIMIGDETDGTVTPQDLGLHWAVSKKKADFIGKRAQERAFLAREGREAFVGLATEDPKRVLPDGAYAVADPAASKPEVIGRVTSTYWSPTLDRSVALGLIRNGPSRMGDVISFPVGGGDVIRARIVDPVAYDKEGARQNV
ncbi:sarcosine oxidase subunit alpha family protein [Pikeienuella piscinae]|uniref:Sarcosine oxidase subunit alpha family protein n=1 Tax=Pikeienuella piscinae TaxID=2748098 RepID=A0A7L5BY23_9RHOB|nr:sarcosine oxidase subunit alpha family protein [Pikeienuella piscinae]QIE55136.1 sarcosine oxidase subunit alpha family protein [Pikeienuella piscinae]